VVVTGSGDSTARSRTRGEHATAAREKPAEIPAEGRRIDTVLPKRGEYRKAVEHYSSAIKSDPSNHLAYLYRADAYTFLNEFEKAVADYTRGIKLRPSEAKAYVSRGEAYTHLDKYDEAILDYKQALRLKPRLAKAHANLGDVFYYGKKDYQAALRHYRAAVKLNPGDWDSRDKVAELERRLSKK